MDPLVMLWTNSLHTGSFLCCSDVTHSCGRICPVADDEGQNSARINSDVEGVHLQHAKFMPSLVAFGAGVTDPIGVSGCGMGYFLVEIVSAAGNSFKSP